MATNEEESTEDGLNETVVRSLVATAGAAVGVHSGPEATMLAAAAVPFLEIALIPTLSRLASTVENLARRAAHGDEAKLRDRLAKHPPSAALLTDAGLASSRTDFDLKIEAIAQAISEGVLYEEGVAFDHDAMLIRIICGLERAQVTVLEQVVRAPDGVDVDVIASQLPYLRDVAHKIIAELTAAGLIRTRIHQPVQSLSSLGRMAAHRGGDPLTEVVAELDRQADAERPHPPPGRASRARDAPPSRWRAFGAPRPPIGGLCRLTGGTST